MNRTYVLILFLVTCGALALAAGCTSPVVPAAPQPNATVTPMVFTPDSLKDLLLLPADLPEGYDVVYRGEMAPGNANCTGEICYITGYFTSAATVESNITTTIDQAVAIYNKNASPENLLPVLADQLPDIAAGNLTPLADPALGDASAAYSFTLPTAGAPLDGYLVIFGKGNLYELIMVIGSKASETLATDMARTAAAKLP
jgi:hypothetical protein